MVSSVVVTLLLIGLKQSGRLQFLELVNYDQMVRLLPDLSHDPRLLLVTVTEEDIKQQKQWPLSDQVLAQLLKSLQTHSPSVIGLDIYRDIPHEPGTQALYQQLQANNIVVVKQLPDGESQEIPPPPNTSPNQVGFSDVMIDPDNVVRRNLMYVQSPSGKVKEYSFALQISLKYLENQDKTLVVTPDALQIGQAKFNRLKADSGGYQLPPGEATGWQTLLKYRGPQVARQVTLQEVLEGQIDPNWVKDKIVLIGVTAPSNKDTFPTPYSATSTREFEMAGVTLHGQMVSQILDGVLQGDGQFWFWPQWLEWLWIWVWSFLAGILVWQYNRLWSLTIAVAIAILSLWGICFIALTQSVWIPFISPLLGLMLCSTGVLAYKVIYRTYHDLLTGLPNRRLFIRQLNQLNHRKALIKGNLVAVLLIDLDRFKTINDGLGHEAGDYLLYETSQRIKKRLNSSDNLSRVGGDEFAICLKSIVNAQDVTILAEQLQQDLIQPFFLQGEEIYTTISIGIAFSQTDQKFNANELLRYADIAMYRAKELGTARNEIFVSGMDTQAVQRWQLETDLRLGLKHQEFRLYYQPIISLKTKKIAGFEALVRWQSSKRGFVSPGDFIPVAEETGLIVPLGKWILEEACRQVSDWHEKFPHISPLIMSVNLSGRQFAQPDLVKQIQDVLDGAKIDGDRIKLEITESMMMNDVESAIELLKRLKGLGLRISIDDFGTGYSSLSYLHRFPIDTLKVDRSFVGRMEEGKDNEKYIQIVRTIVSLGHNLDLDVIAEGLETESQVKILEDLNCEYGQGYFFSKPLSREDAEDLLVKNPEW
ncbi:diguanylate cyclase, GGDEF domain-containing protein [Aphanothece sacrum FPU1]|uniref:Diguanylate cyclase, GGDEF domain-containing protein n=2 Tax=Aphanothece sacrum TaxID=1122 RepID=A0A401IKH7_APHSA|nr:diguanylate cyclase, GGDEF domain-containing protein [Aphanothece sacrum FPU1]GBF85082.1 diguanylate cyclase [Aphanothece sacrum FPU3]